ncbi:MAG: hypothetical protein A2161_10505 [Candidatus Schekmanbacteria bacterium RBG_13_48_7]|uniref:YvlB/LiaX N-terminal domain-containing protein n=1 Tax=Candidatus Schekmanbacteria bacterium RBG_13_48_7 TaxID=1817878 RepID=A0A1F7RJ37_9BACT|nr:MAG: hypothetical protein A2161_10505 [Candidatus Schekmanbacteria bacterium RBG_13_48_7]
MNEELARILKMVEEGKLTADQAAELINALETNKQATDVPKAETGDKKAKATAFCIYVTDGEKKKEVKVKIPKGMVSCIGKFVPKGMAGKVTTDDTEIDLSELLKELENCACGEVISVDKGGKKVRICCE